MNKNILYVFIALLVFAVGCTDDEEPLSKFKNSKYDLSEGEEGSVQRDIYNFYTKYNCLLMLEADSSDYKYNFEKPNNITIVNSDKAYHKAGIEFLNEVWLNNYSEEFKKNNLPFSIILCDKIFDTKKNIIDVYASHGFVAISGVNGNLASMTDEKKQSLSKKINFMFLGSNMFQFRKDLILPNKFYAVCMNLYEDQDKIYSEEEIFPLGFLSTDWPRPSTDQDAVDFIRFITLNTQSYIDRINSTYPKIKEKYDILKKHFADTYNIDILDFTK